MMRTLILFIIYFFSALLYAQPILNSTHINYAGNVNRFSANPIGFTTGTNGINQTWDYSNIALTPIDTSVANIVSSAPFIANFPTANYIVKSSSNGNDLYTFFFSTPSKLEILGIASASVEFVNFSPNPQTLFEFPYTYNLIINDTYSTSTSPSANNPFSIQYDASGILITPFGTYNTFRTKKMDGIFPEYTWYKENTNNAILNVAFGSSGVVSVKFYQYFDLGLEENKNNKTTIYPNPSTSFIIIQNLEKQVDNFNYKIFDITGRTVKSANANYDEKINIEDLTNGNYIIQIISENGKKANKKLLKI